MEKDKLKNGLFRKINAHVTMQTQKRILVSPLDWGLGHATRCIPIIRLLLEKNAEVIIAADGPSYNLLKNEFPQLQFIVLKGYNIKYSKRLPMGLKMTLMAPKILKGIKEEHQALKSIITQYKIDTVISDNRYGLWNKKVKSIFITHQLMVKSLIGERLLHKIIKNFVKNFDECWVPDYANNNNLSGDLSHKYPLLKNTVFIGPLTRFNGGGEVAKQYDVMAIISGPEPQRTIFEKLMIKQLKDADLNSLIVCGKPKIKNQEVINNVEVLAHLKADDMQKAIQQSAIIIARSGYSTIMDLAALGKKVVFIPTPGQTEQEYLAKKFEQEGIAFFQNQNDFDLKKALKKAQSYKGFSRLNPSNELEKVIGKLII